MSDAEVYADYPAPLRSLVNKLTAAGYGHLFLDRQQGRRFVNESLAASKDPFLREIGQQLRDGTMSLRTLGTSEIYREVLERGIRNIEKLDPARIEAKIDQYLDHTQDTAADDNDNDPEDTETDPHTRESR